MPLVLKWFLVEWVEWVSSWMTQAWSASSFDQNRPGQKIWKRLDHSGPRLCMWQLTLQSRTKHSLLTIAKFSWTKKRTAHTHNLEQSPRYDGELARDLTLPVSAFEKLWIRLENKVTSKQPHTRKGWEGAPIFQKSGNSSWNYHVCAKNNLVHLKQANGSMLRIYVQLQMQKISKLLNLVASLGF